METLRADSVLESPGACRSTEESTIAADGVGGREWLVTMVDELTETLGAAAKDTESSRAEARAADAMPEMGV